MRRTVVMLSILTLCTNVPRSAQALTHVWSQGFTGVSAQNINSVVTDPAGNIYAAGSFYNTTNFGGGPRTSLGGSDIFVAKFDPAGVWQWDLEFGNVSDNQFATGVALDSGGNIYLGGAFMGSVNFGGGVLTSTGDRDLFLAKFNAAGVHQWSKRFGDAAEQESMDLTVDFFDNIYWTGYYFGSVDFGGGAPAGMGSYDAYLVKFDATGAHQWSKYFGDSGDQRGMAVATDHWGNVFFGLDFTGTVNVGGGNLVSFGNFDVAIAQYGSAGGYQWGHQYGDAANQFVTSLATDAFEGYLYIAGDNSGVVNFGGGFITSAGSTDIFLAKLDCNGAHLWSHGWGDAEAQNGAAVVTDAAGDVFLAGNLVGTMILGGGPLISAGNQDVFLAEFTEAGGHLWSRRFGDAAKFQEPTCLATDGSNNVIMAGIFQSTIDFGGGPLVGNSIDAFLVKFGTVPSAVRGPGNAALSISAYPNPFNPETTIRYTVPSKGRVLVSVYDARGVRVATLIDATRDAGAYTQTWNGRAGDGSAVSSGIYFARVEHAAGTRSYKMVLLK